MIDMKTQDDLNKAIDSLRNNGDDIAFINRKMYSLADLRRTSGEALLDLLSVRPGMKLYKYCPFGKYAKQNILNGEVHLTNPNEFDDAFDSTSDADEYFFVNFRLMRYLSALDCPFHWRLDNAELAKLLVDHLKTCANSIEEFREYLSQKKIDGITSSRLEIIYLSVITPQIGKGISIESALLDEFVEYMDKHQGYRISCFTTSPINLKMWSLYANYNKGICIEYTVPDTIDLLVLSVAYSHSRGDFNYLVATNDIDDVGVFTKVLFESVLRKDICWMEQDEYRLIGYKGKCENDQCKFFPITGIYMGNKMSVANQNKVKQICKKVKANCYYMQRSLLSFELWPTKIEV